MKIQKFSICLFLHLFQSYGQVVTCVANAYVFGACANLAGDVADEMMERPK